MYRNQYFATTAKRKIKLPSLREIKFGNFTFYLHPTLSSVLVQKDTTEILLLGYIFNPFKPNENDSKTLENLLKVSKTKEQFFKEIQHLSGRYVIFYKNNSSFVVAGDAVHFRQMYYSFQNNDISITSSPKMYFEYFNTELQISDKKKKFIKLAEFTKREYAWIGDQHLDNRINKLLPNHYLDLLKKKKYRLPYYCFSDFKTENDYIEYVRDILRGTYSYLTNRFTLLQPLTAGLDSRALLAASKEYKDKIQYYIFDKKNDLTAPDINIPTKLSQKLEFRFDVYKREKITQEFSNLFTNENLMPRLLSKTSNIQHHYYNSKDNTINISGVVGEVVRCFYGYTANKNVNVNLLYEFSGYSEQSEFVKEEIEQWLSETQNYANENELSILDLFYWEQRLGNWGALYPFEQDIAIEENSPFNNRALLMNLHRISYKKRRAPKYDFFIKLINSMWSDVLAEPINPERNKYIDMLKERSIIRYYTLKTQKKIKKIL